jgi:hypothetical protein
LTFAFIAAMLELPWSHILNLIFFTLTLYEIWHVKLSFYNEKLFIQFFFEKLLFYINILFVSIR